MRRAASASGVERDPGQTMTSVTPASTSSWAIAAEREDVGHRSSSASPPSAASHRPQLEPGLLPFPAGLGVRDDPAAREQGRRRPGHEAAAKGDHQLAVAVGAEPADRAGVPAAIEALVLGDESRARRRAARRRPPASGGAARRAPAGPASSRSVPVIGRHEVLDVSQRQDRRARRRRGGLDDRGEAGAQRVDHDGVLLAVLLAREQGGREPGVVVGVRAARRGTRDRDRLERAPDRAHEALRGRAEEGRAARA